MKRTIPVGLAIAILLTCAVGAVPLLNVHFIDVGWGDAILIDYGVFEALIDGGSDGGCSSYLADHVDGFLELVVASSTDPHPLGGLDEVLERFAVATLVTNGSTAAAEIDGESRRVTARAGDRIPLADLQFDVLHPAELSGDPMTDSLVLRLSFLGWEFLFAGSIDAAVEEWLIADGLGRIDVLKVARHGASDATSSVFLGAAQPIACVVSVGTNPHGYPASETFERIACAPREAIVFRTDVHGHVVLSVTDEGKLLYRTSVAEDPLRPVCTKVVEELAVAPSSCACDRGDALNCADFPCQPAAQRCYELCLDATGDDIHGLDQDEDGIACEELPEDCP